MALRRPSRALIADDDPLVCDLIAEILRQEGYEVMLAKDGREAIELFQNERPDAVVLDLKMPQLGGVEVLDRLKAIAPDVPVVILTGYGDIPTAVDAMRRGAYDFLSKPFIMEDFVGTLRRALERQHLLSEVASLKRQVQQGTTLTDLMGPSQVIQAVIQQAQQVAASNFSVVIQGETGTGKELVARAIHQHSERNGGPLVALDCGAVPDTLIESELFGYERGAFTGADRRKDGYFQLAQGGTLFLDEITNLPLSTQAKLLRALQERSIQPLGSTRPVPVDVRLIAATNVPLDREVQSGRFRRDLYYRLCEFTIQLPPLRERTDDIPHLAVRFLDEVSLELRGPRRSIAEEAMQLLIRHPWPGNVRELRNVIRRAALVGPPRLVAEHVRAALGDAMEAGTTGELEPGTTPSGPLRSVVEAAVTEAERRAIVRALETARGNKSEAARALGIDYKTLHLKMKRYRLDARRVVARAGL